MHKKMLAIAVGLAFAQGLFAAETGTAGAKSAEKPKFADKSYDLETGEFGIKFGDGAEVSLKIDELSAEMQKRLALHGLSQKVGDSYAGAKGDAKAAHASASDVIEQLKQGVWRAARDDEARPRLEELAQAIARIKDVDVEKAKAAVEKATDDQRKTWRSNAKVKAVIAQIRAENAAAALEKAGEVALDVELS